MADGSDQSRTVLLTLGRLPVALDLARAYASRGFRVIVAEPFNMHLCRMSKAVTRSIQVTNPRDSDARYLDDLESIVRSENVELVIPVSEETPRVALLHDRLEGLARVFSSKHAQLIELHDKYRFASLAGELGFDVAPTWTTGDQGPATSKAGYVAKPRYSCSGRGVRFLTEAPDAIAPGDVLQERLVGQEVSGFGIAVNGRLVASTCYRALVLSGSVAVAFERFEAPGVEDWMRRFVDAIAYTGFIAFDFILDEEDKPRAIECNPRASSGIHFLTTDSLAPLIAGESVTNVQRDSDALAESWSCYSAALSSLPDFRQFAEAIRHLRRARDVSWQRRDPWPFLLMPVNTARIIVDAIRERSSFAEVAVRDVEWRVGEEDAA